MIHLESIKHVNIFDNDQNNTQIKHLKSLNMEDGYHNAPLLTFMGSLQY